MYTTKCLECGEKITVPDDDCLEVICPRCNTKMKITHLTTI